MTMVHASARVGEIQATLVQLNDLVAGATGVASSTSTAASTASATSFADALAAATGASATGTIANAAGATGTDVVAAAEKYLGVPYVFGGEDSTGMDCSGLVQQALLACGRACPRDTDQQALMGRPVETLARGDLVFWRGHVAIMLDGQRILHANGHHMATAVEPLSEAIDRIDAAGSGQPVSYRRLD